MANWFISVVNNILEELWKISIILSQVKTAKPHQPQPFTRYLYLESEFSH